MLNLHQLSIFHAVAASGSVSGGAVALMISQPAVSKQIRTMERSLKTPLFDRHAKGVTLTCAGVLLADYTRRIFSLLDEVDAGLADIALLKRGSLSIGAGPTVGTYLLPKAMVRFRREHPQVLLKTETQGPDILRQRLTDGIIELAITETPLVSPQLRSKVLMHDVLVPVTTGAKSPGPTRLMDEKVFCRQPFIARQVDSDSGSLVERTLAARGLRVTPVLTVSTTEAIKQAVIAGLGVAVVSRMAIHAELQAGLLQELQIKSLRIKHPIHLIHRREKKQSPLARQFLEMLAG